MWSGYHHEYKKTTGVQYGTNIVEIFDILQLGSFCAVLLFESRWVVEKEPAKERSSLDSNENLYSSSAPFRPEDRNLLPLT